MRFFAYEKVPRTVVAALGEAGHEIAWIRTAASGSDDDEVLAWAMREERILLTFDKDFGELAGRRLAGRIATRDDWARHFSVIEPGRIRMRPLA